MFVEPCLDSIRDAAARIAPHARVTPVLRSDWLDRRSGARLFLKAENQQRIGAFKFRGACNAVFSLGPAAAARGVLSQSSGNHGAAVALACALRGIPARIVVPENAPQVKQAAIREHGAQIVPCGASQAERDRVCAQVQAETGAELVHPFDDPRVISGQGTVALELLQAVPELDAIVAPVSGGGLLSGIALAARALKPRLALFGAEPQGADDAWRSLRAGRRITGQVPDTICDGLRAQLSERTFAILSRLCDDILRVEDSEVRRAMQYLFERTRQVVEPSGAIALAAVLRYPERFCGLRVGVILSGGNLDLSALFPAEQ